MFCTRVEIPSDISKITEIEDFVDCIMTDCSLQEQYRGVLSVPLTEAVRNAIVHGNGNDRRKMVRIACQQEQGKLVFSVADEGNGFPFDEYRENGRHLQTHGLSAIFALCDEVRFRQNGSVIAFSIPIRTRQPLPQHRMDLQTMKTTVLNSL
ncbi:MAG: ATP-binding protein [Bacteroidales bacterium]|nr:ATP-binding protein [Bacteroidales bacterium]